MAKNKKKVHQYDGQQQDSERIRKSMQQDTTEFNDNIWVSNSRIPNQMKNPGGRSGYVRPYHNWNMLDYLSMVPFGVAAAPFVTAAGEAAAATTAGQTATNFLLNTAGPALARSKVLPWINAGLTSVFGAPHAKKVVEGDINNADEALEAGLMLSPLGQVLRPATNAAKTVASGAKDLANRVAKFGVSNHTGNWVRFGNKEYRLNPGMIGINGAGIQHRSVSGRTLFDTLEGRFGYRPNMEEVGQYIASHPEVSVRGIQNANGRNIVTFETQTPEQFADNVSELSETVRRKYPDRLQMSQQTVVTPVQAPQQTVVTPSIRFGTRSADDVEKLGRWRREQLFDANGNPLFNPGSFDYFQTGAHGSMLNGSSASPEDMWRTLSDVTFNPHKGRYELSRIRQDNPAGRSGVILQSHDFDLSTDSHPLAHTMIDRSGIKEIVPIGDNLDAMGYANNLGSVGLYMPRREWRIDPYLEDYIKSRTRLVNTPVGLNENGTTRYGSVNEYNAYGYNDPLPFDVDKLADGSLQLSTPRRGVIGYIPARTPEDLLENSFNRVIRRTNERYKINLPAARLTDDLGPSPQFTIGRSIQFPIFGSRGALGLKKGGRIKLVKRKR